MTRPGGQQGLSLLEFTLVVVIFGILVALAADRFAALRVDIERAAIERSVTGMQSALAVRFSELLVRGRYDRIAAWEGGDALQLIRAYHRRDEEPGLSGPGEWSYQGGEIVYRPAYPAALTGDPDAVGRWRVELIGTEAEPRGLRLRTVEPLNADRATQRTES